MARSFALSLQSKSVSRRAPRQRNGRFNDDSVAQLVEQVTLNHWVVSSSLTGVT